MAVILPLDKQHIPLPTSQDTGGHGKRLTKPALDPYWLEDVNFLSYQPPPVNGDVASLEEWNERLSFLEEDLHWLLKQPHHLFWSQVVFDETLQQSLDSYLHKAPRPYDPDVELPDHLSEKHRCIHRLIFMVFLRMATYKESKEHSITPHVFGEILYDNFLFDIVKIMELCVLYGGGNDKLLSKMVENIFTQQPKYNEDLRETVPTILEVLDRIEEKCGKTQEGADSLKKLGSNLDGHVETMTAKELQDVIFYIMDTAQSLNAFLEIYPPAAKAFHQKHFVTRVASFYEVLMPELEMAVKKLNWESQSLRNTVKKHLHLAKLGLAQTCITIISTCCIKPILESSSTDDSRHLDHIDDYLELIASLLSEKHFLTVFAMQCNIEDDIDLIIQSTDQIDETRTQFILDGIRAVRKSKRKQKMENSQGASSGSMVTGNAGNVVDHGAMVAAPEDYQTDAFLDEYGSASVATNAPSGIQIDSFISSVKDLFPEFGDGFIEACLEEYNFDSSKVINDILEDKLPPGLQELDRNLERSATPPPEEPDPVVETVLTKRANIYENDEFDVFTRDDVDTSRIHKGKKVETDTAYSVLADKSDVQAVKAMYDEYSYQYEDEYDDTYDQNDVGAGDADSADELMSKSYQYEDEYDDTYDQNDVGAGDADSADELMSKSYQYEDEYDDTYDQNDVGAGDADSADELMSKSVRTYVLSTKAMYDEYSYQYEDEYDDTYDQNDVGAGDADSADELMSKSLFGRPFTTPRVLEKGGTDSQEGEQEEEEESEEEDKDMFERPPQHNQAHRHQQGRKQQVNQQAKQKARQDAIKGQQKGKGQSQDTQKERRYKDKNKSSRANHNRKAMADKKRSRAMGPLG
ncbi:activating signal cointegrator 1 complex subunit 2-like [Amphiura filiformis]|uniref:activating signal cointegrator 1 complex subunit 2-like n=1 Tax=Amphiura filiformis TaxID=82378 RepID=UPI003B21644B